jgi:hypothetical protein
MADAIDTRIHPDEQSFVEPVLDPLRGDSGRQQLPPRDHPVLPSSYRGNDPVWHPHTGV